MTRTALFRTDASLDIGTGHVMRCLTLADTLSHRGVRSIFACREHSGHLLDTIARKGHRAIAMRTANVSASEMETTSPPYGSWLGVHWRSDAEQTLTIAEMVRPDWLVVDHYALDAQWEQVLRAACPRVMVIDDLADRQHDCHLLLDQNLGRREADYRLLVGNSSRVLVGPRYALLRAEFGQMRSRTSAELSSVELRHILVMMGGVDRDNMTCRVLDTLNECTLPSGCGITVVMGRTAPFLAEVRARAASMRWPTEVLADLQNIAELLIRCDLVIGAAGSSSWERCALGVPSVAMVLAENQRAIACALGESGAALPIEVPALHPSLRNFIEDTNVVARLARMRAAAWDITDGLGAARVAEALVEVA